MRLLDQLASRFAAPKLTRGRMTLALAVAMAAEGVQILVAADLARGKKLTC